MLLLITVAVVTLNSAVTLLLRSRLRSGRRHLLPLSQVDSVVHYLRYTACCSGDSIPTRLLFTLRVPVVRCCCLLLPRLLFVPIYYFIYSLLFPVDYILCSLLAGGLHLPDYGDGVCSW